MHEVSRRHLLLVSGAALASACAPASGPAPTEPTVPPAPPNTNGAPSLQPNSSPTLASPSDTSPSNRALAALETHLGGRVGVCAIDTQSGRSLSHRADERFAMCSTFKWTLAAAILARVDRGELRLDERVSYKKADLLDYAPTTTKNVATGSMTIEALAEAIVTVSDNTAANLLLARIDGPAGLTRFLRSVGDDITRLDRNEPELNENLPDDPRDTTSPSAMAHTMQTLLAGDKLTESSRDKLLGWLIACATGKKRLRAGFPEGFRAGDKTGTGNRGAANDVAIVWPPNRSPIVVASYLSDSDATADALNRAHAEIGRLTVSLLA